MSRVLIIMATWLVLAACFPSPVAVQAVGEAAQCVAALCNIYSGYPH